MFVRMLDELRKQGKEIVLSGGKARTVRLLTREDGMGFSLSDLTASAGAEAALWYKKHWEANYIVSGHGEVDDLTTGESWALEPGTMYCVGPDDRHGMHAITDLHLVSVFCPALQGDEMHDEDGAMAPSGPVPPGPKAT